MNSLWGLAPHWRFGLAFLCVVSAGPSLLADSAADWVIVNDHTSLAKDATAELRDTPYTFDLSAAEKVEPVVDKDESHAAVEALERHLSAERNQRQPLKNERFAETPLTRADAERAGKLLWQDHVNHIRQSRAAEMVARELTDGDLKMPY